MQKVCLFFHELFNFLSLAETADAKGLSGYQFPPSLLLPTVTVTGSSVATQVSLPVSYSSSGPSLEQQTSTTDSLRDSFKELGGESSECPAIPVAVTKPQADNCASSIWSSPGNCPLVPAAVVSDQVSHTEILYLETSDSPSPTPSSHGALPQFQVTHGTCDQVTPPEDNSLNVEVDEGSLGQASVEAGNSLASSETGSQLSSITSCSEEDNESRSLTPHPALPVLSGALYQEPTTAPPSPDELERREASDELERREASDELERREERETEREDGGSDSFGRHEEQTSSETRTTGGTPKVDSCQATGREPTERTVPLDSENSALPYDVSEQQPQTSVKKSRYISCL